MTTETMEKMPGWALGLHSLFNGSKTFRHLPHVFSINERQHTQVHHVPRCAVVVAHEVEGHGDVRMAVVKAQIVLQ